MDEFGPLEIRPYPGYHWARTGKQQRFPATYHFLKYLPPRKFALSGVYYTDHKAQMSGIRRYIGWRNRHKRDEKILKEQTKVKVA